MAERFLLGVDIGTCSSQGILVGGSGRPAATAGVEHALSIPAPGRAEHDAEAVWWGDFRRICRDLLSSSGIEPRRIAAVGVSTISPAVVPVDERGRALRPAILYGIDTRATREIAELAALTGASLSSQSASPKVLWIRRNEPEVWKRTRRVVNGSGFLVLRLTGESVIDVYDATLFSPFFDAGSGTWSAALAPHVAPVEMMPRASWTAQVAGTVGGAAAKETGLAEGTPVIAGTADAGGTATAGSLTRWFRDGFAPTEREAERGGGRNAYETLAELASSSPPGSRGLVALPYFSGERTPLHDPEAKGAVFGLTLSHTRADFYRSLLESVGYAIRHNIEALAAEGCRASRILAVGGGTRNAAWMRMVSDIAGIEQVIPEGRVGACHGDAFLAGIGAGLFRNTGESRRWARPARTVVPDPAVKALYDTAYGIYRGLYERNAGAMKELGGMAQC